jgi:hypothetical protein
MARAKLHIEGASQRPEAIRYYLDYIDKREYDSVDAVMNDIYRETGLDVVDTKGMSTTLAKLGLVNQHDRQQLTEYGRSLVDILLYDEELFYELLHFRYATAYHRDPSPDRAISWSYYQICRELTRRSPTEFNSVRQDIIDAVEQRAKQAPDDALADPGPLSTKSLNNHRQFLQQLDPDVYDSNSGEFSLRSFARSELVLAAVDHLYRTDLESGTRDYGNPMELSGEVVDHLCTLLLVQEEDITEVVEHVASMDARLSITPDYQLMVRLSDPVEINDLA